jgi:hypothetical protein
VKWRLKKETAWDLIGGVGVILIAVALWLLHPAAGLGWSGLALMVVGVLGAAREARQARQGE